MTDWRKQLLTKETRDGGIATLSGLANVLTILSRHEAWTGVIVWDDFRESAVVTREPPWDANDAPQGRRSPEWTEADSTRAAAWLARHEAVNVPSAVIDAAVVVVAERTTVHPVREYLLACQWDGVGRVDTWLAAYLGTEQSNYTQSVGRAFAIGAVARVFRPGAKVDTTIVLEGKQGIGKSTAIRVLAGDAWFFDTPITMGDKDGYQALAGKWIGELGELHALSRSDLNRAKNFLTATTDRYRPSFGRRTRDFPRQCVFVGSTNASEYLRDETGNRRFHPVRCGAIDLAGLRRDRDQFWAEARTLYEAGQPWHVSTREFAELAAAEQDARFVTDPWEDTIETWLACASHPTRRRAGVTPAEVLGDCLEVPRERWTKGDQDRVAAVLRRLGWERGKQQRAAGGVRERRWRPQHQVEIEAVTDPMTGPVTRQNSQILLMSPVSPVHTTHAYAHGSVSALGSPAPVVTPGDVVTEGAAE